MTETTNDLQHTLDALKALASERYSIDRREYALMQSAEALGATWQQIAETLGLREAWRAAQQYEALEARIGP